jgi:hypothetical protein
VLGYLRSGGGGSQTTPPPTREIGWQARLSGGNREAIGPSPQFRQSSVHGGEAHSTVVRVCPQVARPHRQQGPALVVGRQRKPFTCHMLHLMGANVVHPTGAILLTVVTGVGSIWTPRRWGPNGARCSGRTDRGGGQGDPAGAAEPRRARGADRRPGRVSGSGVLRADAPCGSPAAHPPPVTPERGLPDRHGRGGPPACGARVHGPGAGPPWRAHDRPDRPHRARARVRRAPLHRDAGGPAA